MTELFLTIFNAAVTAGWLVLAVVLVRLVLKKAPAWSKVALWAIVALRLIWPFEIQSAVSMVPSRETVSVGAMTDASPSVSTGIPAINGMINAEISQSFAPTPDASVNPMQVAAAVASWVWVAGVVIMLLYSLISFLRLRRQVRVRMPVEKDVYLSDGVQSPFILGIFRPQIYLPSHLEESKWDPILRHERAHLARKDHWWKPLGFLLLAVFWFHPLLWLAYILLCRDVEQACDEKVIRDLTPEEKQRYSSILLECSLPRKWVSACPLAFGEGNVKRRIKAVLHYKKPTIWIIIASLLIIGVLAVCFLTDPVEKSKNVSVDFWVDGCLYQVEKNVGSVIVKEDIPVEGNERIALLYYDEGYEQEYNNEIINEDVTIYVKYYSFEELVEKASEDYFEQYNLRLATAYCYGEFDGALIFAQYGTPFSSSNAVQTVMTKVCIEGYAFQFPCAAWIVMWKNGEFYQLPNFLVERNGWLKEEHLEKMFEKHQEFFE